jgi:hypothetical protein
LATRSVIEGEILRGGQICKVGVSEGVYPRPRHEQRLSSHIDDGILGYRLVSLPSGGVISEAGAERDNGWHAIDPVTLSAERDRK